MADKNGPLAGAEPLPAAVEAAVQPQLGPEETVRLHRRSDIDLAGNFGERWLLATDRRLFVVNPNHGAPMVELELPLSQIERVEAEPHLGNGILRIETRYRTIEAARYSKTLSEQFRSAAKALERLAREGADAPKDRSDEREAARRAKRQGRCPRCGRAMNHHEVCTACLQKTKLVLRLMRYVQPFWFAAAVSFLLMLVITAVELAPPYLSKIMVDEVILKKNFALLKVLLLLILAVHASSALLSSGRGYLMAWLGQSIIYRLRMQVYEHLQRLSLRYYDSQQTGQIMSRVTRDTGSLQDFLAEGFQDLLRNVLTCLIIGVMLFTLDWRLASLTLVPVPLLAVGSWIFATRIHPIYHQTWRQWGALSAILADTIPGVRVVKAFAQERREVEKFAHRNRDLMRISLRASRLSTLFYPAMGFVTTVGSIIVWGYGGAEVIRGGLTLGVLVAYIGYLWRFYGPIQQLSQMNDRIQRAATAAERVFEVLDTEPEITDAPDAIELESLEGHIEFDHVTFAYEEDKDVLKNVSFEVRPGEMVGLVGPSGAGKSTTINLICRFYDVKEGAIRVDGHDLRDVTHESLRQHIGMVLQEPFLFHGTIAENIAYSKPDASLAEVIAAAKAANAHEFILNFPDGYDTFVGERGARLSGGERQRIAIARAILKDPRILILDEATSSVDTETEVAIREAIDRLIQNRTTIAIAHRFSTLRNADRLIVLDQGQVVEVGTHEELMAKEDGLFARLCHMQAEMSKIVAWNE